jgi:ABC-type cobalamin/Fe3+-siderophores transport system ATPase subunit
MSAVAIDLRDLIVQARGRRLLDIPKLQVPVGGCVALLGPNGAGKTTLLRACLGLVRPAAGSLSVLGEDVTGLRGAALSGLRRRIGHVPQLLPARSELPLTVREVVAIGRTARAGLFHALSRADDQVVDCWITRLGLAPLASRAFNEISGGEQRKTIIARAMAQEPELLLLDEPTANLDLGWRERIVETIGQLHAQTRLTILLVCHELEVLPPACRQVALLEGGRLMATGAPEEVFTTECVTRLYGAGLSAWHSGGRHAVLPEGGRG